MKIQTYIADYLKARLEKNAAMVVYDPEGLYRDIVMSLDGEGCTVIDGSVSTIQGREAAQAWIEQEYNRKIHSELGTSPLRRMLDGTDQSRPSPDTEAIRQAFTRQERRVQRKSDGTISLQGVRFEIPSRFRHLPHIHVRYQSWDMSIAYIVDSRSGRIIGRIHPQDKAKNADGHRRSVEPTVTAKPAAPDADPIPPLLRKILSDYAATGMPPAYLPVAEKEVDNDA